MANLQQYLKNKLFTLVYALTMQVHKLHLDYVQRINPYIAELGYLNQEDIFVYEWDDDIHYIAFQISNFNLFMDIHNEVNPTGKPMHTAIALVTYFKLEYQHCEQVDFNSILLASMLNYDVDALMPTELIMPRACYYTIDDKYDYAEAFDDDSRGENLDEAFANYNDYWRKR